MIGVDLTYILQWWVVWFALGLIFLPITSLIFSNFFDRGYAFSKILGILAVSYLIWVLGSIKILPFTLLPLLGIIAAFLIVSTYLAYQDKVVKLIKPVLKIILLEELLFLIGLIFWSMIRGFEPSIHGLEKFMDFGFINSILRTEYFPPKDLWLTPLSINYYYFGHLVTAVATKLSGIDPIITYNLMLATLFGLTLSASFSIGANLYNLFAQSAKQAVSPDKIGVSQKTLAISGFLSAFLVTLGGNLHTIYVFFASYVPAENPVPFWQLPVQWNIDGYWYPNATRFIQNTIHEFPIYSFVVSDLHGHVLSIPFILLIAALLIALFHRNEDSFFKKVLNPFTMLLGLLVASALMSNILDGPIYLIGIFLVFLSKNLFQNDLKKNFKQSLTESIKLFSVVFLLTILFSLPFWLSFKPFASGIGVLCAPNFLTEIGKVGPFLFEADHCARSPLWQLSILWGFSLFVVLGFAFFTRKELKKLKFLTSTDRLVLTLAFFALILIIIPELFYAKDIYPAHYRANTIFKFGYQAFIILGLISGYMITRMFAAKHITYRLFLIALFFLVAIYPLFAINSYYGNLKNYKGLDGFQYFAQAYPSDYRAILWLRDNITDQPVILEAQGDSYTDYARVSANTGIPTVVGWPVHEWLWRGSYDEAGKRSTEVTQVYETEDINYTRAFLQKYNVKYVFVGALERQKYLNLNEEKFKTLGTVVFQDGDTIIYQITK